jgi:hypothetical protein
MVSLRIDMQTAVSVSDTSVTISYYRKPSEEIPLNKLNTVEEVWHRETVLRLVTESKEEYTINASGPHARGNKVLVKDGNGHWTRDDHD